MSHPQSILWIQPHLQFCSFGLILEYLLFRYFMQLELHPAGKQNSMAFDDNFIVNYRNCIYDNRKNSTHNDPPPQMCFNLNPFAYKMTAQYIIYLECRLPIADRNVCGADNIDSCGSLWFSICTFICRMCSVWAFVCIKFH